ncbi:DUF2975 domain-containing protein [Halobacillus salinus]|nr:DUF2975 domain-containing protein [Halobacillus salinus]
MRKTLFLKVTVYVLGAAILILSVFWLPWMSGEAAEIEPSLAYLRYPVLVGIYITAVPFFLALYEALRLLKYIDHQQAFSEAAVHSLRLIKYCALAICSLYAVGSIFLITQSALHPGIALVGLVIIFACIVIAMFGGVLQQLLKSAIEIKIENEWTI